MSGPPPAPVLQPALQSALHPAGPVAQAIADMGWLLIAGSSTVFAIVMALLWWAVRHQPAGPRQGRGGDRWWLVGGGLVFPLVVLAALLLYTALRTAALTPPRLAQEPIVTVTGHMWWWQVRYLDPARGIDFSTANQIHIPAGRAVTLGLSTADVIHSFWVPALAGKVDMVPGRTHQLRVQADAPGLLRGQCAEFCGAQHALMALHVVAQTPADHARWLQAQQQPALAPQDAVARRGLQVFGEQRCGACHTVRGAGAAGTIGPDLTHVGSRLYLGAGTLAMGRKALRQWVADPQHAKPGVRMPSYARLDAASLDALTSYLEQLQ